MFHIGESIMMNIQNNIIEDLDDKINHLLKDLADYNKKNKGFYTKYYMIVYDTIVGLLREYNDITITKKTHLSIIESNNMSEYSIIVNIVYGDNHNSLLRILSYGGHLTDRTLRYLTIEGELIKSTSPYTSEVNDIIKKWNDYSVQMMNVEKLIDKI